MRDIVMIGEVRDKKEVAKDLRKNGIIPAVIYSHGKTNELKLNRKHFISIFPKGVKESVIFTLDLDGKKEDVFVKDYHRHPVTGDYLHIDLFRITKGEKVKTKVPLEFIGIPVGVPKGGVVEIFIREIEIETLPQNLSSSLKVDVTALEIGDTIHLEDIKYPPDTSIYIEGNPIIFQVTESAKSRGESEEVNEGSLSGES